MAKLVCECGFTRDVPILHGGPGIPSKKDPTKLECSHGCCTTDIPKHCGKNMKYTT